MKTFKKFVVSSLLFSATILSSCTKGNSYSKKYKNDSNKDSLLALLTFDHDEDNLYKVCNEAKPGTSYDIENFRNDVTNNIFYQNPSPAYRNDSQVDGKALVLDGYSNYIDCGKLLEKNDAFTVDLWVALRSYEMYDTNRSISPLIECYDSSSKTGFVFGFGHFGLLGVTFLTPNGKVEIYPGEYINVCEWTNLSMTYENGLVCLYKNGVLFKQDVVEGFSLTGNETLSIGRNTYDQRAEGIFPLNWISGSIDEVRIYSKALDSSDITKLNSLYLQNGNMPTCTFRDLNFPSDYLNDNVYRTLWHGLPSFAWVSDTNGGFYYNGNYHLFFTKSDFGPELRSETWGHVVSPDMIRWREVAPAIRCENNDYDNRWVYAGSGAVINNVPYLFYTGFIWPSPTSLLYCTISMCKPKDLNDPYLEEWEKMPEVKLHLPTGFKGDEFRDPQIYIEHDTAFLVVVARRNNGNPCVLGFSAPVNDITNWTYRGVMFEVDYSQYKYSGYMWEVPIFLRLTSPSGNKVKYLLAVAPMNEVGLSNDSIYFLGDFDWQTCRFTVTDMNARRYDLGSDYHSCSGGEIYDPIGGHTVLFETLQCCWNLTGYHRYQSGYSAGWNMGRYYSLDEDGGLVVNHIDYSSIYGDTLLEIKSKQATELEANYNVGRSYRLNYKMKLNNEQRRAGFSVLSSKTGSESFKFYYDNTKKRFVLDEMATTNPCSKFTSYMDYEVDPTKDMDIEIFVDHSCVEVFIDNKAVMSGRAYNNLYCTYIVPIGSNWIVNDLIVNEMKGVY